MKRQKGSIFELKEILHNKRPNHFTSTLEGNPYFNFNPFKCTLQLFLSALKYLTSLKVVYVYINPFSLTRLNAL